MPDNRRESMDNELRSLPKENDKLQGIKEKWLTSRI